MTLLVAIACASFFQAPDPLPGAETTPQVVRIRVPTDLLVEWSADGQGVRSMPALQFEQLLEDARRGARFQARTRPPRLVRAEHRARWDEVSGLLLGRSRLLVEGTGGPGGEAVSLDGWSPAVRGVSPDSAHLLSGPEGNLTLRAAGPEPTHIDVEWVLRAREGSGGRSFVLGLPGPDSASLVLDLPDGTRPEGPVGSLDGPVGGNEPGRAVWRFDGPGGASELRLRGPEPRATERAATRLSARVGGSMKIDLRDGVARWEAIWTVSANLGSDSLEPLVIELDPGLAWTDVTGADVASCDPGPSIDGGRTTATVRWKGRLRGPSEVRIRGLAKLPGGNSGPWRLPAVRPRDTPWLGGPVEFSVGPGWSIARYTEIDGRSAIPEDGSSPEGAEAVLRFDSVGPGPAAEVDLRPSSPRATAAVRGELRIDSGLPRFRARVALDVSHGSLPELDLDIAPGWRVDHVRAGDTTVDLRWDVEPRPDGGGRLRVALPGTSPQGPPGPALLVVEASAQVLAEAPVELNLPRLKPVDLLLDDEVWLAWTPPRLRLVPSDARGLAWLDPAAVAGDSPDPGLRADLAWRWLATDGVARAKATREPSTPSALVTQNFHVRPGRADLSWRIDVRPDGQPIDSLVVSIGDGADERTRPTWRLVAGDDDLPLDALAMEGGSALRIPLPGPMAVPFRLEANGSIPWSGDGLLPTLSIAEPLRSRGRIRILVVPAMRTEVEAPPHIRRLDPAGEPTPAEPVANNIPASRLAHSFEYDGDPGQLRLKTALLPALGPVAVIEQAALTTLAPMGGPLIHRLALTVNASEPATLVIDLPVGAQLERATLDGAPIGPSTGSSGLRFGLPSPGRSVAWLEYSEPDARSGIGGLRAIGARPPRFSLPCLAFSWQVAMDRPWRATKLPASVIEADPVAPPSGWAELASPISALADLGSVRSQGTFSSDFASRPASIAGTRSVTLAVYLAPRDAGQRPLVVDRTALASLGIGPSTSIVGSLSALGLTLVIVDDIELLTSTSEEPTRDGSALAAGRHAWRDRLREAVAWGTDRTDRFQRFDRWTIEPARSAANPPTVAPLRAPTPAGAPHTWSPRALPLLGSRSRPSTERPGRASRSPPRFRCWSLAG